MFKEVNALETISKENVIILVQRSQRLKSAVCPQDLYGGKG